MRILKISLPFLGQECLYSTFRHPCNVGYKLFLKNSLQFQCPHLEWPT